MATLTRTLQHDDDDEWEREREHEHAREQWDREPDSHLIGLGIPAPFPSTRLDTHTSQVPAPYYDLAEPIHEPARPAALQSPGRPAPAAVETALRETAETADAAAISAIYDLQLSVISTLQHILVSPSPASVKSKPAGAGTAPAGGSIPITRRHSMPTTRSAEQAAALPSERYSPLRSLLTQLVIASDDSTMAEIPATASGLARELRRRISDMRTLLPLRDYQLAHALCSLASDLAHVDELSAPDLSAEAPAQQAAAADAAASAGLKSPADIHDTLQRQIARLQAARPAAQSLPLADHTPVALVQRELLWNRIESVLDDVRSLCREPADPFASPQDRDRDRERDRERDRDRDRYSIDTVPGYFPPSYDHGAEKPRDLDTASTLDDEDDDPADRLPAYEPSAYIYSSFAEKPRRSLDLDDIAEAIDHFNRVNPQLVNQRVEMDPRRAERMEMARLIGAVEKLVASGRLDDQRATRPAGVAGKGKERAGEGEGGVEKREREDGRLWELIERSTARRLEDQSVEVKGGMQGRLAKADLKVKAKRVEFMTTLVQHSSAGRMTSQDAVMRPNLRDPEALLSFPEFMRESAASASSASRGPTQPQTQTQPQSQAQQHAHGGTIPFSKQEFAATEPEFGPPLKEPTSVWSRKRAGGRDRSLSAPPLAWLKAAGRDGRALSAAGGVAGAAVNGVEGKTGAASSLSIYYVAENLARLQKVNVTFMADGLAPKAPPLAAEVPAHSTSELVVSSGEHSARIKLPVPCLPGKQPVRYADKTCTLTLAADTGVPAREITEQPDRLLAAPTLAALAPSSFICASCSLHLVRAGPITRYDDLPSEYWDEMVDMWVCDPDAEMGPEMVRGLKGGTRPAPDQALVGGSYILFNWRALVEGNLRHDTPASADEPWSLVRCLCGQILGQTREDAYSKELVYRLTKYGIRAAGTSKEPPHIPISAYVVQDMREIVEAHACYHFILHDEQEGRARILIWMFNASVEVTWAARKSYFLPKEGSSYTALVFYKVIGPSMNPDEVIASYPDFLKAEHLYYPIDVCRRLAALLRESHNAYADGAAQKGLDKAWLARE